MPPHARVLDIVSEMGELSKEVLKNTKYVTADFVVTEDFVMEYGDVLYSLLSLANEVGIDSVDALDKAIEKYKSRITQNGNMGSGR
ncbi:MAG: nucleotide pyrophosphohydrolase [Clostridia bacterium]|nr:nucleotide pyrophosphohydrolase [Clostridia bacterium]